MLDNLIVSLKAVFPLFTIMAIGYLIRRRGMIDDASLKKINGVCFKVFMAFMMFNNVYSMDLSSAFRPRLLLYTVCTLVFLLCASIFLVLRYEPEDRRRGVLIQAIYRGNFVVLGLPLVASVYGQEALAVPTMLISFVIPCFNVSCVVILTYFGGGEKKRFLYFVREVITNPYIVAAAIGFLCLALHIRLPEMVCGVIKDLAGIANPLALIILGASFSFQNVGKYRRELVFSCAMKLVVFPALMLGGAILLGFRGIELMTLLAVYATPTAIASHVMAQQLGGDADLAGVNVVICTALSVLTLFLWIFGLKSFGLL